MPWEGPSITETWSLTGGTLRTQVDIAMDDIADAVFDTSQSIVPVKRGALKLSGHVIREPLRKRVRYQTSYAAYQEYLKSDRPGHPYLRPSYEQNRDWAIARLQEAVRIAIHG